MPTWCAAIAAVPIPAAIIAVDMKPTRISTCSTKTEYPTLMICTSVCAEALTRVLTIYGMLTKLSFGNSEQTLMTHATTVPNTVAIAAPWIPSAGNPRWPLISR